MKIICIGRNYHNHIKELNNDTPSEPMFFLKPDSAILPPKNPFFYPEFSKDINYEVELVFRINRLGKNIDRKFAHKYYKEIGLGIDFTARDLQTECKEKGLPWEKAKAFDGSAVVSKFVPVSQFKDLNNINFELYQNENQVQNGNSANMIFQIDTLISHISKFLTLKIGDLIFTGTPEGVGPIQIGDVLTGKLEGEKMFDVKVK